MCLCVTPCSQDDKSLPSDDIRSGDKAAQLPSKCVSVRDEPVISVWADGA